MISVERPDRGYSLLELIVAACCTTLLAGAVLPLLVGGARAERHRARALDAELRVDSALRVISLDLQAVGVGLEGGRSVQWNGQATAIVGPALNGGLRLLHSLGPALEIGVVLDANTYEVGSPGSLQIGAAVVAVGLPGRPAGAALPSGTIVSVVPVGGGAVVQVLWGSAAIDVAAWGPPRALLPVTWREYDLRAFEGAYQLRRRDLGGSWQPAVNGLTAVTIRYLIDHDGDGAPDETTGAGVAPGVGGRVMFVRLEASAEPAFGREVAARAWVRVGMP